MQPNPQQPSRTATPVTVPELIARLDHLLTKHGPSRAELIGVVSSWHLNRGWASGELCSHHNGTVDARLPFVIQHARLPADIIDNDVVVAITGTLETRPPWHPVRLHGHRLRIVAQSSVAAQRRHQRLDTMRNDDRLTA